MRTRRFLPVGLRGRAADDDGQVTPFVVILALAIVMFAGLVVDGGLALAAKVRAIGEAQEAARAGAQALDLSAYRDSGTVRLVPGQARTLAQTYLASTGDTGMVTVNGDTVTVTVTAHQGTQLLGLLGVDMLTVTGTGSAHPARGVLTPEP
ncbi:TadE/TadG family type IV pilus assembly protein [Streptomyces fulvoviolaceus]|uniref:TadE/TadG family type IV pilus assembly protein n=1 Tax=Streptomyces fulvoviolaceus TaxID=285535 RepID=UPI0021BE14E6|nr:pilus assembly protein TadG-related protein [Streptomyces fulvoviolaceus]MCT9080468.1 pilus assembly protein TadG-related protein [Streptomyces fulvoviolaceus]